MRKVSAALAALALLAGACGLDREGGGPELPADPDSPVVQVWSTGGFGPVELVLGAGPRYTLLADGRLIYEGPVIAIYPGPLLPNYQVSQINTDQMNTVLELIDAIGLPDFEFERDNTALDKVADAQTDTVHYWDQNGLHTYEVYALGLDPNPPEPSNRAFLDLIGVLDQLAASDDVGEFVPYEVRVIAGVGFVDQEFAQIRDWPLGDTDFSEWRVLPNQWLCTTYSSDVLDIFQDANQATLWTHPDPMMDAPPFRLLVRPLHPGEDGCPPSR